MADTIMWSRAKQVNTNLIIKLNGGSTEGTNLFTYNGSGSKSVNITPSSIGAINTAGTGLSKSGTTLNHKVSVAAANRGPTANATISPGGTISVPYISHDAQGHIISSAARTITLNSNILDTGDIITALGSATSNSKVLGAKLIADNINSINTKISQYNILWSGNVYPSTSQECALSQTLSSQKNGIVLFFAIHNPDDTSDKTAWWTCFIHKSQISIKNSVSANNAGFTIGPIVNIFDNGNGYIAYKYLYISDSKITGHAANNGTRKLGNITFTNSFWSLRAVVGM